MTIPPEIVDRIIDYIHDDPKTLMVCSLVARDWIPSAYFHLFAKLSLFTPDDCVRLTELLNFSPSPLHYCQELTTGLMDDFRKSPHPLGSMAFVQPLLKLFKQMDPFTSLHTLHIRGIPCPTVDFIELLMVISQKIATVNITWCSFRSHHDLWKILRLFPNLQNVHASKLGYFYYNEAGLNIPPNHCHSPPIVSFSVYTHCMDFFLEELAEPPYPLTHLKSLEIHHTDQPQENINLIATKYRDAISTLKFSANSTLGSGAFVSTFFTGRPGTLIAHHRYWATHWDVQLPANAYLGQTGALRRIPARSQNSHICPFIFLGHHHHRTNQLEVKPSSIRNCGN